MLIYQISCTFWINVDVYLQISFLPILYCEKVTQANSLYDNYDEYAVRDIYCKVTT